MCPIGLTVQSSFLSHASPCVLEEEDGVGIGMVGAKIADMKVAT